MRISIDHKLNLPSSANNILNSVSINYNWKIAHKKSIKRNIHEDFFEVKLKVHWSFSKFRLKCFFIKLYSGFKKYDKFLKFWNFLNRYRVKFKITTNSMYHRWIRRLKIVKDCFMYFIVHHVIKFHCRFLVFDWPVAVDRRGRFGGWLWFKFLISTRLVIWSNDTLAGHLIKMNEWS